MIKQGDFEGYCTNAWEYQWQRYMRVANCLPGAQDQTLPGGHFRSSSFLKIE
jgi:hypothetical protein